MKYRLTYSDCRAIRARQRRQRIAIAIALIAALTVVTILAAVKPAAGATDGPFVRRQRIVCMKYKVMHDGNHSQIRLCSRWGIR